MAKIKDQELMKLGGPAFPFSIEFEDECGVGTQNYTGMTLRDYFAGQALTGMNASPALLEAVTGPEAGSGSHYERMTRHAYKQADAMLAARNGGQ